MYIHLPYFQTHSIFTNINNQIFQPVASCGQPQYSRPSFEIVPSLVCTVKISEVFCY